MKLSKTCNGGWLSKEPVVIALLLEDATQTKLDCIKKKLDTLEIRNTIHTVLFPDSLLGMILIDSDNSTFKPEYWKMEPVPEKTDKIEGKIMDIMFEEIHWDALWYQEFLSVDIEGHLDKFNGLANHIVKIETLDNNEDYCFVYDKDKNVEIFTFKIAQPKTVNSSTRESVDTDVN